MGGTTTKPALVLPVTFSLRRRQQIWMWVRSLYFWGQYAERASLYCESVVCWFFIFEWEWHCYYYYYYFNNCFRNRKQEKLSKNKRWNLRHFIQSVDFLNFTSSILANMENEKKGYLMISRALEAIGVQKKNKLAGGVSSMGSLVLDGQRWKNYLIK